MGMTKRKRVGVVGGMGNEAMIDLISKIARQQNASTLELIVFGNSRLANKPEEAMLQWLPSETPEVRKFDTAAYTLRLMQYLEAEVVGLACNSAHELFRKIVLEVPVNFVDMVRETAQLLEGSPEKVLVMAVNSLVDSGIYQKALGENGVASAKPTANNQCKVMAAIFDEEFGIINTNNTTKAESLLCKVITDEHQNQGCTKVVLGCTELPLVLSPDNIHRYKQLGMLPAGIEVIDTSMVLAQALVRRKGYKPANDLLIETCRGEHTDWFAPLAIEITSIDQIVAIQRQIFSLTNQYLAERRQSVTGSYWHLPTLFYTANCEGVELKLNELGIDVYPETLNLEEVIQPYFAQHFGALFKEY